MTTVITILIILIILFLLWILALRCRKGHPAWETLRKFRYAHRGLHNSAEGIPENDVGTLFQRQIATVNIEEHHGICVCFQA